MTLRPLELTRYRCVLGTFQTVITHELGHALGLGGSTVATSPMDEVLAAGMTRRTLAVADLNIPNVADVVDPVRAAPIARSSLAGLVAEASGTSMGSVPTNLGTEPVQASSELTSERGRSQVLSGIELSPRMIMLSPPYRSGGGMSLDVSFRSQDQAAGADNDRWTGRWGWDHSQSLERMAWSGHGASASLRLAAAPTAVMRDWGHPVVSQPAWIDERWLEPKRASGALRNSESAPGSERNAAPSQHAITDWLFAALGVAATVAVPPALLGERRREEQPRIRSQNQSV